MLFINYIILISILNVDFENEEFKLFDGLNNFEKWLLCPKNFNYLNFDVNWLIEIESNPYILSRLKGISDIMIAIDIALNKEYDQNLAEIKYKFLKK